MMNRIIEHANDLRGLERKLADRLMGNQPVAHFPK